MHLSSLKFCIVLLCKEFFSRRNEEKCLSQCFYFACGIAIMLNVFGRKHSSTREQGRFNEEGSRKILAYYYAELIFDEVIDSRISNQVQKKKCNGILWLYTV